MVINKDSLFGYLNFVLYDYCKIYDIKHKDAKRKIKQLSLNKEFGNIKLTKVFNVDTYILNQRQFLAYRIVSDVELLMVVSDKLIETMLSEDNNE